MNRALDPWPPDVIAAAREGGSRRGPRENITSKATLAFYSNARPFAVKIVFFGMAKAWGRYATAAAAASEIARLRTDGFQAKLELVLP